jgi:hypothetical protein
LNLSITTNEIQSPLSSGNKQSALSSFESDDIRSLLSDLVNEIDKKSAEISSCMLVELEYQNKYYRIFDYRLIAPPPPPPPPPPFFAGVIPPIIGPGIPPPPPPMMPGFGGKLKRRFIIN